VILGLDLAEDHKALVILRRALRKEEEERKFRRQRQLSAGWEDRRRV